MLSLVIQTRHTKWDRIEGVIVNNLIDQYMYIKEMLFFCLTIMPVVVLCVGVVGRIRASKAAKNKSDGYTFKLE